MQRLLGKPLAALGELDEHPPPVPRIGPALHESGPLEPIEPRGHRPGGDQRRLGQLGGLGALLVTASTKGVEDVELPEAQPKRPQGGDDCALEVGVAQPQAYGISGGAGLVTNSYALLLASRLVFGIGAAAVFAATTVALFELYRGPGRDRVMGWRSSAISLGGLGWPLVGGTLGALSWHAPFAVYLLGVPLAVACAAALPTMPAETAGAAQPDVGLRALARRRPDLLGFYAMQLISAVLLYAVLVLLPLRLAELAVTDPLYVALCAAALSAAMTAVGFGYARLRARLGDRALLTLSFSVWLVAFAALSIVQHPGLLGAAAALFGIGMGVAVPALTVLVAEAAPAPLRGRATSLSASATFLGQGASPLLLGPIVSATSITAGFAVAAALAGTTLLTALAAGARQRSEVTS